MEKLLWLNHHYIMNGDPEHVARHLEWHMKQRELDLSQGSKLADVVMAQRERCKTLVEMADASVYFYRDFHDYDDKAARKNLTADAVPVFNQLYDALSKLDNWDKETLHDVVINTAEQLGLGLGKVGQPLRVAVSGSSMSPPIEVTLWLLGKETVLARIRKAIDHIKAVN
jgi:glutamyl-tRNA synthetase